MMRVWASSLIRLTTTSPSARRRLDSTCMIKSAAAECVCRYSVSSGLRQDQHFAGFAGLGVDHASTAAGDFGHAEHVAREAEPENDILAFRRRLVDLDPAALQEIDVASGAAGLEDELVFSRTACAGWTAPDRPRLQHSGAIEIPPVRFGEPLVLGSTPRRLPISMQQTSRLNCRMSAGRQTGGSQWRILVTWFKERKAELLVTGRLDR
jgi:hypothetical protein